MNLPLMYASSFSHHSPMVCSRFKHSSRAPSLFLPLIPPPSLLRHIHHQHSAWVRNSPSATWASEPCLVIRCSFHSGVPYTASQRSKCCPPQLGPQSCWFSFGWSCQNRPTGGGGGPSAKETPPACDRKIPPRSLGLRVCGFPKVFLAFCVPGGGAERPGDTASLG